MKKTLTQHKKPSSLKKADGSVFNKEGDAFYVFRTPSHLYIQLRLASENFGRDVGRVDLKERTLELIRNRESHLMRKNNSYGFNEYMIREAKLFDDIELRDDVGTYKFPKSVVLEQGQYLHFKEQGFEKQLFVPLEVIEKFELRKEEMRF